MQAISRYKNVFTTSQWYLIEMVRQYSDRGGRLRSYSASDVIEIARKYRVNLVADDKLAFLVGYLNTRADVLNAHAPSFLRTKEEAKDDYEHLCRSFRPQYAPIKSKQGDKGIAYMASTVNAIAEKTLKFDFECEPSSQVVFCDDVEFKAVSCDRPDGVVPCCTNPRLMWESKEYYTGDNYGSRINDCARVAENNGSRFATMPPERRPISGLLIDGIQLWTKGRPHCCRLFDLLHKGLVDHVIFGREVLHVWEPILRTVASDTNFYFESR